MTNEYDPKRIELQNNIQRWLSPPDPWKTHNIARASRHSGSGAWFVQSDTLSEWMSFGPSALLWVHGKPGSGKSVLCSAIIEEIETMRNSSPASLAIFYCDFREEQKTHLGGLLSSLIFQLCNQSNSYHDILSIFHATHGHGTQSPSDDKLLQCFKNLLELPGQAPIYLIIDALDECPDSSTLPSPREEVLHLLEELVASRITNLRICVTSRPETDIKAILEPLACRSISIHDETGQMEDIENYIRSVVNTDPKYRKWKEEDRRMVIDVLTERADGMFRWVYCQIVYLRGCHPGRIRRALVELPETLDETYERALREINKANSELALRLFQSVAVASKPLRVEELAEFLALDFSAGPIPRFREEWRLEDPVEAVLSTCSTLLSLVNVNGSPVIQFSHFSVKEYLTSSRLAENRDNVSHRYHVSMTNAHIIMVRACLAILLHLGENENVTTSSLAKFPLAKYAAKYWVEHARFEGVSRNAEEGMKQLFDPRKPHLALWLWIYNPTIRFLKQNEPAIKKPMPPRLTPCHYAAFCGLHTVVELLAKEHLQDVHSQSGDDMSTPLHLASRQGHVEAARVLIKLGAGVAARDRDRSTPLHQVSENGNVDLARLLVEHRANVTAKDKDGSTPLHKLSGSGRGGVDLAWFLIEHGANASAQDKQGSTPLHLASLQGNLDLVRFLVERGADVTARTKDGWTPLHYASHTENVDLARFLIEHGADLTAQDKDGSTPMHNASKRGHVDFVRFLVGHGANATAQDKDGSTPLHKASTSGRVDLARFLVERGAKATVKDELGLTPLHEASRSNRGNSDIAQFLVDHGADVTVRDKDGSTPLHYASQRRLVDLAQFLVEHGADVTAQNNNRSTPMHEAAYIGSVAVAQFLVEHGADATAQDKNGLTPLHRASESNHGNVDIAQFLIEHGANVTAQDENGSTPLHGWSGSEHGEVDLARFLVDHGADVTARDKYGSTPLHKASIRGRVDLARFLVERGADVSALTEGGLTPLHIASSYGVSVDFARILVEHGADVTVRGEHGLTPLDHASSMGHVELTRFLKTVRPKTGLLHSISRRLGKVWK